MTGHNGTCFRRLTRIRWVFGSAIRPLAAQLPGVDRDCGPLSDFAVALQLQVWLLVTEQYALSVRANHPLPRVLEVPSDLARSTGRVTTISGTCGNYGHGERTCHRGWAETTWN
jgi:hypothetical protein